MNVRIRIRLDAQELVLLDDDGSALRRYGVSTARNGPGEREGSGCTPRGLHCVRAKIGAGAPQGAVFRGRRPTGEIWSPALARAHPERDWILSRILWLSGCEPGRNRLGNVDTMRRYIYIHGTPDDQPMGEPLSHGCIRMRNADVIDLFDRVPAGTRVEIEDSGIEDTKRSNAASEVRIRVLDWEAAARRVMPLREAVFVLEQGVSPELERDDLDAVCRHAVAELPDGTVVGTGRLLPDGHVGRMAVAASMRGSGIGGEILEALVDEARRAGHAELVLNAQVQALPFYLRHGFTADGEPFMEAGILHRRMRRALAR